jgi:hypothetical protein
MVSVVQNVDQVGIKGVNVVEKGKVRDYLGEAIMVILLGELDFAHVEPTDSADLVVSVYLRWGFALCLGKSYINESLPIRDGLHLLEIV